MKLRKIMAGIAASSLAATLAVSASANCLVPVPVEDADPGLSSDENMWLVQIFNEGNEEENKPAVNYGIDVEAIKSAEVTIKAVEVEEGDLDFFDAAFGGGIVLSSNGGDYADVYGDAVDENYNKKVTDVKNWTGLEFWGTIDEDLGLETIDPAKPAQFVKTGDYTYTATVEFPDSVIPSSGAGCVQLAVQDWGSCMCPMQVVSVVVKDASGNALVSFDEKGVATVCGAAPVEEPTDEPTDEPTTDEPTTDAPTTGDSTKPNTNTGVESLAVVAGVAVLATGAIVVSKKRK